MYGVAVTRNTVIRKSTLGTMSKHELNVTAQEGSPYTIRRQPVKCFPPPSFSWLLALSDVDNSPTRIKTTKRIQIDEQGTFDEN